MIIYTSKSKRIICKVLHSLAILRSLTEVVKKKVKSTATKNLFAKPKYSLHWIVRNCRTNASTISNDNITATRWNLRQRGLLPKPTARRIVVRKMLTTFTRKLMSWISPVRVGGVPEPSIGKIAETTSPIEGTANRSVPTQVTIEPGPLRANPSSKVKQPQLMAKKQVVMTQP